VFVVYYTHVIALISTRVTSDERGFCDMTYDIFDNCNWVDTRWQ